MSWTRHDDQRPITAKMAGLSDAAYRLDDEAIAWCSRNRTDGRIPARLMATISPRGARRKVVEELEKAGRFHKKNGPPCDHPRCPEPGADGWTVHDFLDYQPTVAEAEAGREAKARRQANYLRKRSERIDNNGYVDASRDVSLDAPQDGKGDVSLGGAEDASRDAYPPRGGASARVDPVPVPIVVKGGTYVALDGKIHSEPPPTTCEEHPDGTPDRCGPCGDARQQAKAWAVEQHRTDQARRSAEARARAETTARAIAACQDCDNRGYRFGAVCDHDPATAARARHGAALARQALAADEEPFA